MKKSTVKDSKEKSSNKKGSILTEELYASELSYRSLFESTKDGILILDAKTRKIVDVNPLLIDLLGYSKKEFIEKSIWEIEAFQDVYENKEKFLELQQEEYVRYDDLPLVTSDGHIIHVEFVSNVYLANNNKVIQCNIRDITARKETEAVLENTRIELAEIKKSADELNEFTENVIDTVREPLLVMDKDLRVIKASRSFYEFFKVTVEETIGKLIYELGNHQWNIPKLKELLEKIIPEKNSFDNYEVEHKFSTIGKRVMLLNARQVKRAYGKEKIILLAIEDITERKAKEESLKETQRETSSSLNILLDLMYTPIIIWDTSMIIKRFNHQFELLSGYDSAEVIGKKLDFLFPKEKISATLELLKNHLDTEHLEVAEIDILTKDNQIKTVLWNSSHILDQDGNNIIATISQDITNRRQSELALRQSESHLRTLVNTIPDLIWLKDTNGVFLSCNPMFERLLGVREADIIGKTDYDFVDRKLADFFREYDQKAMAAGKPTSNEEWVTFADDGHRAFLDTIKSPIFDSDGTVLGILGIGRDITERMLAGQKLQASEKRFRAIFDQAPIAVALINLQGYPIISNLRLSEMLGYTKDELSKMMFTEFTYPEDIDKDLNQFTDLIAGKISGYSMTKRYIRKNGNLVWANLFVTTLNDSNGSPQEIIGMIEDITERKKAENKLKENEEKFETITENSADAIFITNQEGKYLYVNKMAVDLLGYSKEEFLAITIADLAPKNRVKEYFQIFQQLFISGSSYSEIELIKKDGSIADTDLNAVLLPNGWVYGSCRDISKRKQLENELIESKNKAEESDRLKTAFLHNISHEIRTPMNAISGFSGFLNDPDLLPDKRQDYIDIVIHSSDQLLAIIDDIMRIASIEAGQEKVQKNEININLVCKLINEQFFPKANDKNVTLSLRTVLPDYEAIIITDATKLTQILTNLVANALKFTHKGQVIFGYWLKDDQLEFYVEDSGIGIPLNMQEKIFNRFRQVETTATRDFGGSGLGLSISKAYVEMLGGRMWLSSELGKGSVFYFSIPYKNASPNKLRDIQSVKKLNYKFDTNPTLLIAEDENSNYMLLEVLLTNTGINLIRAKNGIAAVEFCKSNPHIDLVLMDLKMPIMDGYEATKHIKEFRPDLPIIALTAYSNDVDRNKAMESGCSDFISKPFKRELFLSKINEQLHK